MEHKHSVFDTDTHFVISENTREIKPDFSVVPVIVQHDHNSERLSFELPRYIDGHDMTLCNEVQVHYLNVDSATKEPVKGVYSVEDLGLLEGDENKAVCSWLISENATQYAGKLNFMIRFSCIADDGSVSYRWNTGIYSELTVVSGYDNGEAVTEDFPDILSQWKAELFGIGDTEEQRIKDASAAEQAAITAKGEVVNASIPADYSALSALADQNHRNKAGAIVLNAEGESIVVNDASEYPMMGLKVFGKSTQNGEPSPEYPQEINSVENAVVSVYGKNLIECPFEEAATRNGVTIANIGGGGISVKGNSTAYTEFLLYGGYNTSKTGFPFDAVLSGGTANVGLHAFRYDENGKFIGVSTSKGEAKAVGTCAGIAIAFSLEADITVDEVIYPMLTMNGATGDFEPYKEKQTVTIPHALPGIPVSSGGNYTDANGQQWICDEVDLARGVHLQRIHPVQASALEWIVEKTTETYFEYKTYSSTVGLENGNLLSTHFGKVEDNRSVVGSNRNIYVRFPVSSGIDTIEKADEFFATNEIVILARLLAPIETPLSDAEIAAFKALHSNKPNTTILNDAGAYMAVEYVADTKTYIDNKIAELMAQ